MENTMVNTATKLFDESKKSLEHLLREKAYEEIVEKLEEQGIDITNVADNDVEVLVAEKVREKQNGLKNFAVGGAVALLISSLMGF